MAMKVPFLSKWSEKQIVLAVLTGVLAATVIVIVVSAVLHPVDVDFSVVDASFTAGDDGALFNLTLAANNTGRHTGVTYGSIDVVLRKSFDFVTQVTPAYPFRQPPRNTTTLHAATKSTPTMLSSAEMGQYNFDVLVTAEVQFTVGVLHSRSYTIKVSCNDVNFEDMFKPVNCTG